MNITYRQNGDYLIPNIVIHKTKSIGHYGRLRKAYLEMHRPILFNELVLSDKLFEHCAEIDEAARNRMELIVPELAKQYGVTEQLKAENQMEWVRQMNACPYTTAQSTEQFNIFVKAEVSTNRLLRLFFFPGIFTRTANGTMLCLSAETEAAHRDMLMCEERRKVSDRTLPALINLIRSAMRETAVSSLSLKHP